MSQNTEGKKPVKVNKSKRKGNSFENKVARELSLWLSSGEYKDCLERTIGSGSKSTVAGKKGFRLGNIAGDLMAIDELGFKMTQLFIIELKTGSPDYINWLYLKLNT